VNQGITTQGISLSSILLPIAAFLIGSFLVPKMEWIPNIVKIWIFALGIGLAVFALLATSVAQNWLSGFMHSRTYTILGVGVFSLIIFVGIGCFLTVQDSKYEGREQLRKTTESLVGEITQFVADRTLSQPMPTAEWDSPDEWFQKSREYHAISENLFVTRYKQRILELGNDLFRAKVITQDEQDKLVWLVSTGVGYISANKITNDLLQYCSRLK